MSEHENTTNSLQTPETSKEALPAEDYQPRPARAFAPRKPGKLSRYKRTWYEKNRKRILSDLHAKSAGKPKKPRSARFRKRMSAIKKRQWKGMPAAKRKAVLAPLAAGREKQQATYAAQRQPWGIIKDRLDGIGRDALVKKYGSAKQVDYVLRSADIPKSKACKYDRGEPFTRGSGTELQKSLGFMKSEFARDANIRARRVVIWLTKPQNKLEPPEAKNCIELRDRIAAKLLDEKIVEKLPTPDRYSRTRVFTTLFPRYRSEYKLLLETMPKIREFLAAHKQCDENELGTFVYERAVDETAGKLKGRTFRLLLRWMRELAPLILLHRSEFERNVDARFLAYELLALTCFTPKDGQGSIAKIVKAAVSSPTSRLSGRDMRQLVRRHVYPADALAQPASSGTGRRSKGGQPGKTKVTEARIVLAADLANASIGRYKAAGQVYPHQDDPDQAHSNLKTLYRNHQKAIDDAKQSLAGMDTGARVKLISEARSTVAAAPKRMPKKLTHRPG